MGVILCTGAIVGEVDDLVGHVFLVPDQAPEGDFGGSGRLARGRCHYRCSDTDIPDRQTYSAPKLARSQ